MPNITLMGWNQIVQIGSETTQKQYKVADYSVGINQNFKVEKMVSGATDKLTWSKAKIEVQGRVKLPLVSSTGGVFLSYAIAAAEPTTASYMTLKSSIHPTVSNALVQSYEIKASAENPITLDVEVWGVNASGQGITLESMATPRTPTLSTQTGTPEGETPVGTEIYEEEIPMFDQIHGVEDIIPCGADYGLPTEFSFKIMNNLQRNYILGESLDAWSVSSGQRDLTGTVSWISNVSGHIKHILNTGLTTGTSIYITGTGGTHILDINLANAYLIWSATPPTLNTERVSVSSNFQMIANAAELISLV